MSPVLWDNEVGLVWKREDYEPWSARPQSDRADVSLIQAINVVKGRPAPGWLAKPDSGEEVWDSNSKRRNREVAQWQRLEWCCSSTENISIGDTFEPA